MHNNNNNNIIITNTERLCLLLESIINLKHSLPFLLQQKARQTSQADKEKKTQLLDMIVVVSIDMVWKSQLSFSC